MKKKAYKRRCGDFELRVLPDGRVVMLAPDQELLELAGELDANNEDLKQTTEKTEYDPGKRR